MATTYACSYSNGCGRNCSKATVGEFIHVTVNPRSRQLLSTLNDTVGEKITIDSLLNKLTVNGGKESKNWAIALYHDHLPRLEALGIVEYDKDESVVRYLGCPLIDEAIDMVERE